MSKKLMLLVAGALSALAFAALPAVASAGEYEVHCPSTPCTGTISAVKAEHEIKLENDGTEKISATSITGAISVTSATTSTGTVEITFKGVKEEITGFGFSCNSTGAGAGEIKTGALVGHFINVASGGGTKPAVLLTNVNVEFSCAGGLVTKRVTGNIIGTVTQPNCNTATTSTKVTFNQADGVQEHMQITGTGTKFDLTSGKPNATEDLTTSGQTAHGNISWNSDVTLTC